jgi:hypothetical protein
LAYGHTTTLLTVIKIRADTPLELCERLLKLLLPDAYPNSAPSPAPISRCSLDMWKMGHRQKRKRLLLLCV